MLTQLQKRIITGSIGIFLIFSAFYFNVLNYIFWPLFLVLILELTLACLVSNISFFKKSLVYLFGTLFAYYGSISLNESINHLQVVPLLIGVWGVDSIAFFCGKFFQGKLLAPSISPKKTWSGFLCACLFGIIWGPFLWNDIQPSNSWILGAIFGLIFSITVQIGDLLVSKGKRILKIKDSSALLPGHGGFWDRCDSLFTGAMLISLYFLLQNFEFNLNLIKTCIN